MEWVASDGGCAYTPENSEPFGHSLDADSDAKHGNSAADRGTAVCGFGPFVADALKHAEEQSEEQSWAALEQGMLVLHRDVHRESYS